MNNLLVLGILIGGVALVMICWLGWQLLRQNGRMLLRIEALEQRLDEFAFGDAEQQEADGNSQPSSLNSQPSDDRASRFGSRSLARSKIARIGLKAGTPAPAFCLPCVCASDQARHGTPDEPCDVCQPLLDHYGIQYVH